MEGRKIKGRAKFLTNKRCSITAVCPRTDDVIRPHHDVIINTESISIRRCNPPFAEIMDPLVIWVQAKGLFTVRSTHKTAKCTVRIESESEIYSLEENKKKNQFKGKHNPISLKKHTSMTLFNTKCAKITLLQSISFAGTYSLL